MTFIDIQKNSLNEVVWVHPLFFKSCQNVFDALASCFFAPQNKVKPKDAASNLSYVFSNMVYGLLTTFAAAKLGHDSLFDAPPLNDYLKPTEKTSEQIKESNRNNIQPFYSDVNPNLEETTYIM